MPDRIRCKQCDIQFPNEKYPLNRKAEFLNTVGESVSIYYHEDSSGKRYYINGVIDSMKNDWMLRQLDELSLSYQKTKDERYARRVILALEAYSRYFPHYLVKVFITRPTNDPKARTKQTNTYTYVSTGGPWMRNGKRYANKPSEPKASLERTDTPYGWTQSRWGWGRWGGEIPTPLALVYEKVKDSAEFERLSSERGIDVRKQVLSIFYNAVAYVQEFPFWFQIHNNASSHMRHMIDVGRIIGEPEFVHFGYRWSREVMEKYSFSRDGAFAESPGYIYVFLATHEENFHALEGYVDPPGYIGRDGVHISGANTKPSLDFLQKARYATESMRFPNGSSPPIGDSRHDNFVQPTFRPGTTSTPLSESKPLLLPGYGHAVLGDGTDDAQVQAHLHFSSFKDVVHTHADGLSLMLWAFGAELFTDIGYHKSHYRPYVSTTLSHNTVVVDRNAQNGNDTKGRVTIFEPRLAGLSFVQVEDRNLYGKICNRYRRTFLLNTSDLSAPYLIDIFEVHGGKTHDYVLHGPTVFDSTLNTTASLAPMTGERPLLVSGEHWSERINAPPYGVFTNVRTGTVANDFKATYTLVDPYKKPAYYVDPRYESGSSFHYAVDPSVYKEQLEIGVRTHFVTGASKDDLQLKLFVADSPLLARTGLNGSELTEKLKRPSLILRNESTKEAKSVFVAVHEPYYGKARIKEIRQLPLALDSGKGLALNIIFEDRRDTVIISLEDNQTVKTGGTTPTLLQGRAGVLIERNDTQPAASLIQGTRLEHDTVRIATPTAQYEGTIEQVVSCWDGAEQNAFISDTQLPEGTALRGAWMIVRFGEDSVTESFEIDSVEQRDGRTWIMLTDEPGLRMNKDSITETFFPRRQFAGKARYYIPTVAGPLRQTL